MSYVREFGAVGDGVADDTDAIQHAINDGDGVVAFPRGTYRITRTLVVDLAKAGRTALHGSGATAKLVMAGPGPAILLKGTHDKSADPSGFRPGVWRQERMPTVSSLEIEGGHEEADGIRVVGVMQPTLTRVLIREVRTAVHVTERARNLIIDQCHFYHNRGVGVHLERVNLHQANIVGSHISYCRLGGIRIERSEIRNLQITGCDIEYNNNRSHRVEGADAVPTAEISIDASEGSVREGTIVSNTIQATYSPGGANVRIIGRGPDENHKAGMWTISGNLIGSQDVNVHLTSVRGVTIAGNFIYSGHRRNLLVESSRNIVLGANCFEHNPDYGEKDLCTGIRFEDCADCTITGVLVQDCRAGKHTVADAVPIEREGILELVRCARVNVSGTQIVDAAPVGIRLEDCRDTVLTGCTVLDSRAEKLMKSAIHWTGEGSGNLIAACRIGRGTEGAIVAPDHVRIGENVVDE